MMRNSGFSNHKFLAFILLATVSALNGCASSGGSTAAAHDFSATGQPPLSAAISEFVGQMPTGASALFADTPWGPRVNVELADSYFAASGRECRQLHLRLDASAMSQRVTLACRLAANQWQPVRPVTQVLK